MKYGEQVALWEVVVMFVLTIQMIFLTDLQLTGKLDSLKVCANFALAVF